MRAAQVMDHFGIAFEQREHIIAENLEVPLRRGEVVLFQGESGSGKSSLLRSAARGLAAEGQIVLNLDDLRWDERMLIDLLPLEFSESMQLLAACGLGEAQLLLRTPAELSDGQRYRFRLALALSHRPDWVVADEFTATLDRRLARVVSCNLRKLASRRGTGFLLATTHGDVIEDLTPDVLVTCALDGRIAVRVDSQPEQSEQESTSQEWKSSQTGVSVPAEAESGPRKKKCHRSGAGCGFPPVPSATGRTSLGGITAATSWD